MALALYITGVVMVIQPQTLFHDKGNDYSSAVPPVIHLGNLHLLILRELNAQNASIIGLLEPVSAVIFAFIILNEPVSFTTLAGGALILLGAIVIGRSGPVGLQ